MVWRNLIGLIGLIATAATAFAGESAIRIGILNDQSGMAADLAGPGSVIAARMAVEDFGPAVLGKPIEVVVADHQNKPDIASNIARSWYDKDGVDIIIDLPVSSTALAVFQLAADRKKVAVATSGIASSLTGERCTPTGFQWMTDTYSLAKGIASSLVKRGGDKWFFITADYAFGKALDKDASEAITQAGGVVQGRVLHPFNAPDFSSYLLAAQASGAKVIGLANGAGDLINVIKQAHEFNIKSTGQQLAAFLVYISDVHSIGLETAKGTSLINTFYWDADEQTRAWSKRFMEKHRRAPTMVHAAVYSAVLHYLKAVKASNTDDGAAVAERMREMPVEDFYTRGARVRKDNRLVREHFLYEVKAPAESKYPFDYYKLVAAVPGDTLVKPLSESDCPMARN